MATKYQQLIDLVRDWSNRDDSVLTDAIIKSALRYAADDAYSILQIPPLENTTYFVVTTDGIIPALSGATYPNLLPATLYEESSGYQQAVLPVPSDTTSFIYLRSIGKAQRNASNEVELNANGSPKVASSSRSISFNEKTDIRTFHDMYAEKLSDNFWARQGSNLLVSGCVEEDSILELHYYRRLSALNDFEDLPYGLTKAQALASPLLYSVILEDAYLLLPTADQATFELVEDVYVRSEIESGNWLRDENERALLFGALHRLFDYLQEEDQSQKYAQRFYAELQKLNKEEAMRKASGGNIKVNFNGHGYL